MNPISKAVARDKLTKYLGHFRKPKFLNQGHNDGPPTQLGHLAILPQAPALATYTSGNRIGGTMAPSYESSLLSNRRPANDR